MKKIIVLLCFTASLSLFGQSPTFDWVAQLGGTGSERGRSIATDQAGNIFISGTFTDTTDFDPDPNIYYPLISEGLSDVFVAKFTPDGQLAWAHSFGDFISDSSDGIALDTFGNVLISGFYGGTVDFDPGINTFYLTTEPTNAAFILKLDNNGNFIWVRDFIDGFHDQDIISDKAGNVFITGSFSGIDDFDPGSDTFAISASGSFDVFVLKLDSDGDFVWAKGMGGEYVDRGYSIALDGDDNVYITGKFEGTADFDPGPDIYNMWTGGFDEDKGMFITKLDSEGNFVWAKKVGDSDTDVLGYGITADDLGNTYTTGVFRGEVDFALGPAVNILTSEDSRAFVLKLNAAGDYCWVKAMEGEGKSTARDIVLDKYNNVYTIGYFEETIDFDPGVASFELEAVFWDTYLLKLDSSGIFSWAGSFYGGSSIGGIAVGTPSIAIDQFGNIHTTGLFVNSNDFDPGLGDYELNSFGSSDIFIHKMRQYCFSKPSISVNSDIICQGDTVSLEAVVDSWVLDANYWWDNGDTLSTIFITTDSNEAYTVLVAYADDSVDCTLTAAIDINVLPIPDTTLLEFTSCDSLSAGQEVLVYPAENGCDSIVIFDVLWLPIPVVPQLPLEIIITSDTSVFEVNVPLVPTATMYEWTIPLGSQILSGSGTNEILLDWSSIETGDTVCVSAVNECGSSALACTEIILDISDAIKVPRMSRKTKAIIFPNPVDQTLQILFEEADHRKLQLISARGEVVFQQDCFSKRILIETTHLTAGVYSLGIQNTVDKHGYWEKIVVLR